MEWCTILHEYMVVCMYNTLEERIHIQCTVYINVYVPKRNGFIRRELALGLCALLQHTIQRVCKHTHTHTYPLAIAIAFRPFTQTHQPHQHHANTPTHTQTHGYTRCSVLFATDTHTDTIALAVVPASMRTASRVPHPLLPHAALERGCASLTMGTSPGQNVDSSISV